jgi:hypothetical protein
MIFFGQLLNWTAGATEINYVLSICCPLNDLPIDLLPIAHNNKYIFQGSSLPSLFSFQIHHTVTIKKHKRRENLVNNLLLQVIRKYFIWNSEPLPLPLALQPHSDYKHKIHQSSLHALTMDQDTNGPRHSLYYDTKNIKCTKERRMRTSRTQIYMEECM